MSRIARFAIISAPGPAVLTMTIMLMLMTMTMSTRTIMGMTIITIPIRTQNIRWDRNPSAIANRVASKVVDGTLSERPAGDL